MGMLARRPDVDGSTDSVDFIARQLVGDGYFRLQAKLLVGLDDLDDTSSTNLVALDILAKDYLVQPETTAKLKAMAAMP